MNTAKLITGDVREVLPTLDACSVDAVVTDPPAGISFMGKSWDGDRGGRAEWVAWMTEVMGECLRILKPGGHALVWALPRTSHWTGTALEDAGFEIRDQIQHVFGSGFPKSANISKMIDKAAGAEREIVSSYKATGTARTLTGSNYGGGGNNVAEVDRIYQTAPATPEAAQWDGWGTALKPAYEIWWLCRKPLSESSVAANVLRWGTGAINVDACRIGTTKRVHGSVSQQKPNAQVYGRYGIETGNEGGHNPNVGRWPANLILSHSLWCADDGCVDDCPVAMLDAQSGHLQSNSGKPFKRQADKFQSVYQPYAGQQESSGYHGDAGGASRYFYCAKASRSERDAGLADLPLLGVHPPSGDGRVWDIPGSHSTPRRNIHPTVKPLALMRYLCRLVTPPGGLILDPFAGSGSTGVAAIQEGFRFVGVEREPEYVEIAQRRIEATA